MSLGRTYSLKELEAEFLAVESSTSYRILGDSAEGADGVMFLCPKCFHENGGPIGTHSVICWFVGRVEPDIPPGPGRWIPSGDSVDDLTFVGPGAASVLLTPPGCGWHGFVRDGRATLR